MNTIAIINLFIKALFFIKEVVDLTPVLYIPGGFAT